DSLDLPLELRARVRPGVRCRRVDDRARGGNRVAYGTRRVRRNADGRAQRDVNRQAETPSVRVSPREVFAVPVTARPPSSTRQSALESLRRAPRTQGRARL